MSGASNILDPVEAANNGISRSKHLIASTLDDLSQHHSWLESYHRAERQRAERLRRQEALHLLELRRQRAAWVLRRYAVATCAATRSAAAFTMRHGHAFAIWAAQRALALTLHAKKAASASLSWSSRTAPLLARDGQAAVKYSYEAAERGFVWSVHASDEAGIVFRRALAARTAVLHARAAESAKPARRRAAIVITRTRHRAWAQAQFLEARLALGVMRAAQDAQRLFDRYAPGGCRRTGQALIVRPKTDLICIEPLRAQLPATYAD